MAFYKGSAIGAPILVVSCRECGGTGAFQIPSENVIPVRGEKSLPLEQLAKINYLAISYAALKASELKAGNVVIAGYIFSLMALNTAHRYSLCPLSSYGKARARYQAGADMI